MCSKLIENKKTIIWKGEVEVTRILYYFKVTIRMFKIPMKIQFTS